MWMGLQVILVSIVFLIIQKNPTQITIMNQNEIDELLQSSSQQQTQTKPKPKKKPPPPPKLSHQKSSNKIKDSNDYGEDFQQPIEQEYQKAQLPGKKNKVQDSQNYGQDFEQNAQNQNQNQYQNQNQNIPSDLISNNNNQQIAEQSNQPSQASQEKAQIDKIQSEYASQAIDDIDQSLVESVKDGYKDKDDDLSLAQSEFIQSGKLDQSKKVGINKKDNTKQKQKQKQKPKIQPKPTTPTNTKPTNKQIKGITTKPTTKTKPKPKEQPKNQLSKPAQKPKSQTQIPKTKPRRTEQQISSALKQIQEQKKQLEQKRNKRVQAEEQQRKKIYEQALRKQKQVKQKNRLALQQQRQKTKKTNNNNNNNNIINNQSGSNIAITSKNNIRNPSQQAKAFIQKQKNQPKQYKYKQMTKQRKQKQKQIQDKIAQQNKQKLKQLQTQEIQPSNKLKGQQKKKQFIKVRQNIKQAQVKQKKKQQQEQDVLLVKKVKKQIQQNKKQNKQKQSKIFQFDKIIQGLRKQLKNKQKQYYDVFNNINSTKQENIPTKQVRVSEVNFSDLSPIQKFVTFFPDAKNTEEIYRIIDENNDGILTLTQILSRLKRQGVSDTIIDQIYKILDKDSDGNITKQQFAFNIEAEIQRQIDYRAILGEIQITDPIEIQAKIIDMSTKIAFMDKKIKEEAEGPENKYERKYKQYLQKINKIELKSKKQKQKNQNANNAELGGVDPILLQKQYNTLENQCKIQEKLLQTLRGSFQNNLNNKNKVLMTRVQENLRIQEQVYKLRNQIQETQLRYLSFKKIEENKKGYLEKRSKQRAKMQELYSKTSQYQLKIADPTKQSVNKKYARDVEFLAAVIMIQRNFRARKARKQFKLKKQQSK